MATIPFTKMHGAGNDFVIIDNRNAQYRVDEAMAKRIADRRFGVGCDQVVLMESSIRADVFMRIYNADGGEVDACGNASRCVAWLIMNENKKKALKIETNAGVLECTRAGDMQVTVDMGMPKLYWEDIPLSQPMDTLHLTASEGGLSDAVGVSMGNPHAVFFVDDSYGVNLEKIGPALEHNPLFPERANINVAQIESPEAMTLRVWERGAGETLACGTGACASLVAAHRRGLMGRKGRIRLPGGELQIEWQEGDKGHVLMTGPVAVVFEGTMQL